MELENILTKRTPEKAMRKIFRLPKCCQFNSKNSNQAHRDLFWKVFLMILVFFGSEIIQQSVLYATHSSFENTKQSVLGLSLLSGLGLALLVACYVVFCKVDMNTKAQKYKLFTICLLTALGITVISCECSPWSISEDALSYDKAALRFYQLKNFKIALIAIFYMNNEKTPKLGIWLYATPYLYLILRFEDYSSSSCELLVILVLLLIAKFTISSKAVQLHEEPTSRIEIALDKSSSIPEVKERIAAQNSIVNNYNALLNALPEGVMILDENGKVLQLNEALLSILECSYSEAADKILSLTNKEPTLNDEKKKPKRKSETSLESPRDQAMNTEEVGTRSRSIFGSQKMSRRRLSPVFTSFLTSKQEIPSVFANSNQFTKGTSEQIRVTPPIHLRSHKSEKVPKKKYSPTVGSPFSGALRSIKEEVSRDKLTVPTVRRNDRKIATMVKENLLNFEKNYWANSKSLGDNKPEEKEAAKFSPKIGISKFGEESKLKTSPASDRSQHFHSNFFSSDKGHTFNSDPGDRIKTPNYDDSHIKTIEQIAERQALSMKPELQDLVEKLRSNNLRSHYATVREAIKDICSIHFNNSPDPQDPNSNSWMEQSTPAGKRISRSNSDGLFRHHSEKRAGASAIINSYLKVSSTKVKYLETKICPLLDGDHKLLLVLVRDDTSKDIARRLHLMDQQKAATLANTVHDLRAPLGAIMSSLECISLKNIDPELLESFVKPASYAAQSLMFLINDILDLHQNNMKKLQLSFQKCNIRSLLASVIEIFRFKAEKKRLELKLLMDESIPQEIVTDPNRLQQILVNLLSNAFKFTEKGSVFITVSKLPEGRIRVAVADTGIGIKEHDKAKIFTTFGRIRSKETDALNPQGVGLGLVISHKLAQMLCQNEELNGLRVESAFGLGSEFHFIIDDFSLSCMNDSFESHASYGDEMINVSPVPVITNRRTFTSVKYPTRTINSGNFTQALASQEGENLLSIPNENFSNGVCNCNKVLVVDDNEFSITASLNILKLMKLQRIEVARNGKEALDIIVRKYNQSNCCKTFDWIFMDCQMPVMDGITTAKEIDKLVKENKLGRQRIIGLSGYSAKEVEDKCKKAGMMKMLVKPLTMSAVKTVISS